MPTNIPHSILVRMPLPCHCQMPHSFTDAASLHSKYQMGMAWKHCHHGNMILLQLLPPLQRASESLLLLCVTSTWFKLQNRCFWLVDPGSHVYNYLQGMLGKVVPGVSAFIVSPMKTQKKGNSSHIGRMFKWWVAKRNEWQWFMIWTKLYNMPEKG